MGTWDVGPFDNDSAADWCGDLDEAAPGDRPDIVRAAFTTVIEESDGYLDSDVAVEAVVAAAVVASQLPGGSPLTTPYAPDFLIDGGHLTVPADLPALALRALDRVVAADSEWAELWSETGELDPRVIAELQPIRDILTRAAGDG